MVSLLDIETWEFGFQEYVLKRWSLDLTVLRPSLYVSSMVSRLSRLRPRYLTWFSVGIVWSLNVTGIKSRFLSEKVTWTNLISFILIFHLFVLKLIIFKWFWIISPAVTWFSWAYSTFKSQNIFELMSYKLRHNVNIINNK